MVYNKWINIAKWTSAGLQLLGAAMIASSWFNPFWSLLAWWMANIIIAPACYVQKDWSMFWLFIGYFVFNNIGLYNWGIRS